MEKQKDEKVIVDVDGIPARDPLPSWSRFTKRFYNVPQGVECVMKDGKRYQAVASGEGRNRQTHLVSIDPPKVPKKVRNRFKRNLRKAGME